VRSALDQSWPVRVVVVIDGPANTDLGGLPIDPRVQVVALGVRQGGNVARMVGVRSSTTELVAFLDDDDEWDDRKLEKQVRAYRALIAAGAGHGIVSCRATLRQSGRATKVVPKRVISPGESVAEYIFVRRTLQNFEADVSTSTLLTDAALLRLVPWDETLSRHQDWDWLIRATRRTDVVLTMLPEALVLVRVQDTGSVSMAQGCQSSSDWILSMRADLSRRQLGDFLLFVTAPIAIRHRDFRALARVVYTAVRVGRPGPVAWLVLGAHLVPSRLRTLLLSRRATRGS
jgi:hypothetical protein